MAGVVSGWGRASGQGGGGSGGAGWGQWAQALPTTNARSHLPATFHRHVRPLLVEAGTQRLRPLTTPSWPSDCDRRVANTYSCSESSKEYAQDQL